MKKIIIFGAGNHAKVLFYEIVKIKKFIIIGFVDDFVKKGKVIINYQKKNYKNLGSLVSLKKNTKNFSGIIAIGSNFIRKQIVDKVSCFNLKIKWETIISKNAVISKNVKIGEGTVIISGSQIGNGSLIGKHCLINSASSLDHDNTFQDYSSTGPGTVTGGSVVVGKMSHLGIGAVVKQNIRIKENTIIGANSYVNKDCLSNHIYFGTPAIKIRKRKYNEIYL
jgi:sugar O-acyltransferase (sialic acid O-acetyltransferase NeuD family)